MNSQALCTLSNYFILAAAVSIGIEFVYGKKKSRSFTKSILIRGRRLFRKSADDFRRHFDGLSMIKAGSLGILKIYKKPRNLLHWTIAYILLASLVFIFSNYVGNHLPTSVNKLEPIRMPGIVFFQYYADDIDPETGKSIEQMRLKGIDTAGILLDHNIQLLPIQPDPVKQVVSQWIYFYAIGPTLLYLSLCISVHYIQKILRSKRLAQAFMLCLACLILSVFEFAVSAIVVGRLLFIYDDQEWFMAFQRTQLAFGLDTYDFRLSVFYTFSLLLILLPSLILLSAAAVAFVTACVKPALHAAHHSFREARYARKNIPIIMAALFTLSAGILRACCELL